MAGYTKLFSSILASTIWEEPDTTRIVWITMLAMADRDGIVEASIPGLARLAKVPLEACQKALETLAGPDPYSRTPDNDGRRVEAIRGGFRLLNYDLYRWKMDKDDQADKNAKRQKRYRERHRNVTVTQVTHSNDIAKEEAKAKEEEKPDIRGEKIPIAFHLENFDADVFFEQLCRVYKRAERGYGAQTAFCEAVERVVRRHGLCRTDAAGYIVGRAEKYCELEEFQFGMTRWLREEIYEQDDSTWSRNRKSDKPKGKLNLDELYGKD